MPLEGWPVQSDRTPEELQRQHFSGVMSEDTDEESLAVISINLVLEVTD